MILLINDNGTFASILLKSENTNGGRSRQGVADERGKANRVTSQPVHTNLG